MFGYLRAARKRRQADAELIKLLHSRIKELEDENSRLISDPTTGELIEIIDDAEAETRIFLLEREVGILKRDNARLKESTDHWYSQWRKASDFLGVQKHRASEAIKACRKWVGKAHRLALLLAEMDHRIQQLLVEEGITPDEDTPEDDPQGEQDGYDQVAEASSEESSCGETPEGDAAVDSRAPGAQDPAPK